VGLLNAGKEIRTIKTVLLGAEREAHWSGDSIPGPEHLLISATELPDGTAARALERVGVDPAALRTAIEQVHVAALENIGIEEPNGKPDDEARASGDTPDRDTVPGDGTALADETTPSGRVATAAGVFRSTPQAQQVFQEAVALSKSTRPSRLPTRPSRLLGAHVVAAICALEQGTAARALSQLGVDRHQLRAAALDEAREAGPGGPPWRRPTEKGQQRPPQHGR
jgi:ATP-dependent Clp protease ATP-binding subunit ClpA